MANNGPTYDLAQIIGNGYSVGRTIGSDFASSRYRRAEAKLRKDIMAEAEKTGVDPETLYTKYVDQATELADKKGVTRRGITGAGGKALNEESALGFKDYLSSRARSRAGAQMADGKLADGATALSRSEYLMGNIESGMKLGQGADTIRATSSALGKDGSYDELGATKGLTGVSAKYGDHEGASGAQSKTVELMNKQADTLYGRAATYLSAGTDEGNEAALGYINTALSQFDTRWGSNLQMRYDAANDKFTLLKMGGTKEEPTSTPISWFDAKDAVKQLETFISDPSKVLEASKQGRAANAAKDDERRAKKDEKFLEAVTTLNLEMTKILGSSTVAKNVTESAASATSAGWKFLGESRSRPDGSTEQSATLPDGKTLVTLVFNTPTSEAGPGQGLTIIGPDNVAIPGDEIPAGEAVSAYMSSQQQINSMSNAATIKAALKQGIGVLHATYYGGDAFPQESALGGKRSGGPRDRGSRDAAKPTPAIKGDPESMDYDSFRHKLESGGKADAKAPTSSALGIDQFVEDTWMGLIKQRKPSWAEGKTRDQILAMRKDKNKSAEMEGYLREDNAKQLKAIGADPTNINLYVMHHFNPKQAKAFIKADDDTPVSSVLSAATLSANPYLKGLTKGEAIAVWTERATRGGRDKNNIASSGGQADKRKDAPAMASALGSASIGSPTAQQLDNPDGLPVMRGGVTQPFRGALSKVFPAGTTAQQIDNPDGAPVVRGGFLAGTTLK